MTLVANEKPNELWADLICQDKVVANPENLIWVFRRSHVNNNPINAMDYLGLCSGNSLTNYLYLGNTLNNTLGALGGAETPNLTSILSQQSPLGYLGLGAGAIATGLSIANDFNQYGNTTQGYTAAAEDIAQFGGAAAGGGVLAVGTYATMAAVGLETIYPPAGIIAAGVGAVGGTNLTTGVINYFNPPPTPAPSYLTNQLNQSSSNTPAEQPTTGYIPGQ